MGTTSSLAISRSAHSLAVLCRSGFRALPARGMLWSPSSVHGRCASTQACLASAFYGQRLRGQRARHVSHRRRVAVSQVYAQSIASAFYIPGAAPRGGTVIKALPSRQQPSIYTCGPGDRSQLVAVGVVCYGYSGATDAKAAPAQSQPYACQVFSFYAYAKASSQRVDIDYISVILWQYGEGGDDLCRAQADAGQPRVSECYCVVERQISKMV